MTLGANCLYPIHFQELLVAAVKKTLHWRRFEFNLRTNDVVWSFVFMDYSLHRGESWAQNMPMKLIASLQLFNWFVLLHHEVPLSIRNICSLRQPNVQFATVPHAELYRNFTICSKNFCVDYFRKKPGLHVKSINWNICFLIRQWYNRPLHNKSAWFGNRFHPANNLQLLSGCSTADTVSTLV